MSEISTTLQAKLDDLEKRNSVAMVGGGAKRIEKHKQGGRFNSSRTR